MPDDQLPIVPALTAAMIAVLVGVTSSVALVFAAAERAGATPRQVGSWIFALCVGKGLCAMVLSLRYRTPILLAWSTPGAALLATMPEDITLPEVTGAFVLCGLLLLLTGITGAFDRMVSRIPLPIASGLLAGVLARFALDAFSSAENDTLLIVSMFAAYIAARQVIPKFSAICVLGVGVIVAALQDHVNAGSLHLGFAHPTAVRPTFSLGVLIGVGVPLYIVTMAAQNIPGTAALRSHGYHLSLSPALTASGIATTLLAPFGLFAINLAAITASMVMGPDIHPDRDRRYPAAVFAGGLYVVVGILGGSVAGVLDVLPRPLVLAVAGFALLPTIATGLTAAVADEKQRDAAVVTALITASGVTLAGVGAAFWAVVAGALVLASARLPRLVR